MGVVFQYGSNSQEIERAVGRTFGSTASKIRSFMNVPESASAEVNGNEPSDDYKLQEGDVVTFTKDAGSKSRD